jgi:Secretion system C-terminal sorting domain
LQYFSILTEFYIVFDFFYIFHNIIFCICNQNINSLCNNADQLTIWGNSLEDLSGLENITYVGGNVSISNLASLNNIQGLQGLVEVGGSMSISGNPLLTSLEGLENLQHVGVGLSIGGNAMLDLSGLEGLTSIDGYLKIHSSNTLKSLNGVENLTSIGGHFEIAGNDVLESLSGVDGLQSVGLVNPNVGSLIINNNDVLPSLNGLNSLTTIAKDLEIYSNYYLLSLTGLENLNSIGGAIDVYSNFRLVICNLPNLCDLFGQVSSLNFDNNSPDCNSVSVIESNCINYGVCPTDITLLIQTQIDHFQEIFPNCADIAGNLTLTLGEDVSNLEGLFPVESIGGNFLIEGPPNGDDMLLDLSGLGNLQSVAGDFTILFSPLQHLTGLEGLSLIGGECLIRETNIQSLSALTSLNKIGGDISIYDNQMLSNLQGMEGLGSIGGNFIISNNSGLLNLKGLSGLDTIPGLLSIRENNNLSNLAGLENMTFIGDYLWIEENESLLNFWGLNQLTKIDSGLFIRNNTQLQNFQGLENLEKIGKSLDIGENNGLINLSGLGNLMSIGEDLYIHENDALKSLLGLGNLKTIGRDFRIGNACSPCGNPALEGILDMNKLDTIGRHLIIWNNENLYSLYGFESLHFIGGDLYSHWNPNLSECSIWPICNYLSNPSGDVDFYGNATGCSSVNQILNKCGDIYSAVKGNNFVDMNCNGTFDTEDALLKHHLIKNAGNNLPFASTNVDGEFERLVPPDSFVSFYAEPLFGFTANPVNHSVSTDTFPQIFTGLDFYHCPDSTFLNLSAGITAFSPPRPGFSHQYQICIENLGTLKEDATLYFDFSGNSSGDYASIIDAAGGTINGNSIEWSINNLQVFEPVCLKITVEMSSSTPLETLIFPRAVVESANGTIDVDEADNIYTLTQEVVGSYDPNDKTVNTGELPVEDLTNGKELEYLIRFQNTGTFPATFIEVLDTLEQTLDMSTFRMLSASHPYELSFPAFNVVKWRFTNINLPDSISNEPESHGFVKFSIKPADGLVLNDTVSNRSAIYFDFNEPIFTNAAVTNIGVTTSVNTPVNELFFEVYPNPAKNSINLTIPIQEVTILKVIIFDALGKEIKDYELEANSVESFIAKLDLSHYSEGLYFIKITAGETIGMKKFILQ